MNKLLLWLSITISLFTLSVEAGQVKIVTHGGVTHALISRHEPNRITVVDDRIKSVIHKAGTFSIQDNKEIGDIFITPSSANRLQTLSLFIHTEKSKTYQLILTPQEMPSQNLVLRPAMLEQNSHAEPLVEGRGILITKIMKALWSGEILDAFLRTYPAQTIPSAKTLKVTLVEALENHRFQGAIYEVRNISKERVDIQETDFLEDGVVAINISKRTIRPNEVCKIYLVRGK